MGIEFDPISLSYWQTSYSGRGPGIPRGEPTERPPFEVEYAEEMELQELGITPPPEQVPTVTYSSYPAVTYNNVSAEPPPENLNEPSEPFSLYPNVGSLVDVVV